MATITVSANRNIDELVAPIWVSVISGSTSTGYVFLNPQSSNWSTGTITTATTWNSVCYGNNMVVAVAGAAGAGNTSIAASAYEGLTWTQSVLPSSAHWKSVAFGNDRFVAIAYGQTNCAYTDNGVNWVAGGNLPSAANWEEIAFGEGTFVAVGGTNSGAYSTDGGLTWNASTLPTTTGVWTSVTYGGGVFVAVSYGSADAATSVDGITWDAIRSMPSSQNWKSVCYGADLRGGMFWAVAYNSNASAWSVDGGQTWTGVNLPATGNWTNITYGLDNVAVITDTSVATPIFYARVIGSTTSAYSINGTSWVADTATAGGATSSCYCPKLIGDLISIVDGATVTVNTDQTKSQVRNITITNGKLNITNTSTSTGLRFPLKKQVGGSNSCLITVGGLGELNVTGNWIEIGTGNGAANQTITSWTNDPIPFVWVETGSGTGIYEKWANIVGSVFEAPFVGTRDFMSTIRTGEGGKFFTQGLTTEPATGFPSGGKLKDQFTTTLTFGNGTNGNVIPSGAKVRIPNIVLTDDTPLLLGNVSYVYHANIDMQTSGTLVMNTCILSDMWIQATQAKRIWLTSTAMCQRPLISKINDLIFNDVGLGELPANVVYPSNIRTIFESRIAASAVTGSAGDQVWTYLNGAVFDNIMSVHTMTNGLGTNSTGKIGGFQYCTDITVKNFTSHVLNAYWQQYGLHIDFVNNSLFENIKVYGSGYQVSNCNGTTINGLEYLEGYDNRNAYLATTQMSYWLALDSDKNDAAWVDGTDYYFRSGNERDTNQLYPIVDGGFDYHIKPFTPTLATFPYIISVMPGVARNDVYWVMNQYPRYLSPAIEVFWDTQPITAKAATITIAAPGVVTMTGHGFTADAGRAVVFSTSGTLPTGIVEGTTYYARPDTSLDEANQFWLYDTLANANTGGATGRITTSGTQSGNHICTSGNRLLRSASSATAVVAHTSLSNGTLYYYVIRAHETAGNVLDVNCCDSPSYEGTPRALPLFENRCLQSRDLTNVTSWVGTNLGTRNGSQKYGTMQSTVDLTLLVPSGNATLVQTITGLTAGNWIFHFQACDDGLGNSIDVNVTSGANSQTTTCNLKAYPQLYQVAITIPGGSTSAVVTLGYGTTWTNGERIYAGVCNFAPASQPLTNIPTTATAITGFTTDKMFRVYWDWKNRVVLYSPDFQTTATNLSRILAVVTHSNTRNNTISRSDIIIKGLCHQKHYFLNNINCTFNDFKNSALTIRTNPASAGSAAAQQATVTNCSNSSFTKFVLDKTGQCCARLLAVTAGCKNLLFANWDVPEYRGFAHDISVTYGQPIFITNDCSDITFQNIKLGTKYTQGFLYMNAKNSIIKGMTGGNSANSLVPGLSYDSVLRDYTSVFDNNFYETFSGATTGTLSFRFNGTELTTGSAISMSGDCGFDATGKWYAWGTNATLTLTVPYKLESTTAFRNLTPQYFSTFWTSIANAERVLRPLALTVEYKINTGAWTALTAANLSAETITGPFNFAIKFTVNRVVEYDTEANGGFAVGNVITGVTSGATATVEEVLDLGTYGQLRLSGYTKGGGGVNPFVNNELLQVGGSTKGTVNQGTTYSDNTFPNAGAYISALDIYTTVDQSVIYPPYTGGTLTLPTTVTTGGDYVVTAPATINFAGTATPTLWDLSSSTLTTTPFNAITLTNTSGAPITVSLAAGLNLINTGTGSAAITVVEPTNTLTVASNVSLVGAEVRVYDLDNIPSGSFGTEITGGTESSPNATVSFTIANGNTVWIQILKTGYVEVGQTYTMGNTTTLTIPLQLEYNE